MNITTLNAKYIFLLCFQIGYIFWIKKIECIYLFVNMYFPNLAFRFLFLALIDYYFVIFENVCLYNITLIIFLTQYSINWFYICCHLYILWRGSFERSSSYLVDFKSPISSLYILIFSILWVGWNQRDQSQVPGDYIFQ